jgi:transposase
LEKRVLKPSERYPNLPVEEVILDFSEVPGCGSCGEKMTSTELFEESEQLHVIPKRFVIRRKKRKKYRCSGCHGPLQTAPLEPTIIPGCLYSDELQLDVVHAKFCDLVPIGRYCTQAERLGVQGLPPHSLIECTHRVADFLSPIYESIRQEVLEAPILHADETPHRMLEGDSSSHWYLWSFSSKNSSYFETHGTRSGQVASTFLAQATCHTLVSDVYSGYLKALREANEERERQGLGPIQHIYCNAHCRRRFVEAETHYSNEVADFIADYATIYHFEALAKGRPPPEILKFRQQSRVVFERMRTRAETLSGQFSRSSALEKAVRYFLQNYEEFTRFTLTADLPIDNNPAERLLRNPVIGRKTWYGTHSKLGAKTTAIHFTIIESCKLNKLNPREYLADTIAALHRKERPMTPFQYAQAKLSISIDVAS